MGPDASGHLDRALLYEAKKKPALAVQHRTEAKWILAKIEAALS